MNDDRTTRPQVRYVPVDDAQRDDRDLVARGSLWVAATFGCAVLLVTRAVTGGPDAPHFANDLAWCTFFTVVAMSCLVRVVGRWRARGRRGR